MWTAPPFRLSDRRSIVSIVTAYDYDQSSLDPADDIPEIAVIGGSGLYALTDLKDAGRVKTTTPFGRPSDAVVVGTVAGRRVAFLARHGEGHRLSPSEVPYRANLFALRRLGVRQVLAIHAVGSLDERYAPGDLVVPSQVVDRTKGVRAASFFGAGAVAHAPFADPFCARLRELVLAAARRTEAVLHDGATYCCIEGPRFSTRAEAELHRSWGMGLVGMTAVPEAGLAREAGLCYASLSLVTDYDCWHEDHDAVTADLVARVMARNVALAQRVVVGLVASAGEAPDCSCRHAIDGALMTTPSAIPAATRKRVGSLLELD
jgi:5'-methylthioadenosine phosphorylase